ALTVVGRHEAESARDWAGCCRRPQEAGDGEVGWRTCRRRHSIEPHAMIYRSHRYPAELIDVAHLTSGERVVIRPVLPQDRELLVKFFHDLSPAARCRRFMHPINEPSLKLMRQFTQVDYATHVALIAEIFAE